MSYSFKDEVATRLPTGMKMVRMYSTGEKETSIEVIRDTVKHTLSMPKVNIADYFRKTPIVRTFPGETYNDLYARISKIYALGLEQAVDYYNVAVVESNDADMVYVTLPINKDSYGYYGSISVYLTRDPLGLSEEVLERDLAGVSQQYSLSFLKFKSHLVSQVYTSDRPIFVDNRLSIGFVTNIMSSANGSLNGKSEYYRDELIVGVVIDMFSDGLSDLVLIKLRNGQLVLLRFKSEVGDLPVIKNSGTDLETDNSKEGSVGDDDKVSENPGDGEGDLNIPNGSEDPNSNTEGNLNQEEDIDLEF